MESVKVFVKHGEVGNPPIENKSTKMADTCGEILSPKWRQKVVDENKRHVLKMQLVFIALYLSIYVYF